MRSIQTRRHFLAGLTTAGAATLASARGVSAQEAPLETTTVRFSRSPGICIAPQYVAEDLIRAEGLSDFRYVDQQAGLASIAMLARSDIDFAMDFATALAIPIDQGAPIKVLAGVHVGCYELFAHEGINSVLDLKGKTVGAGQNLGSDPHVFVTAMATHVGLDPLKDINWVTSDVKPDGPVHAAARSTPSWASRPSRRNSAPARLAMSLSTAFWTAPGPNTTAACWPPMRLSWRNILPPPSGSCAPFSRPTDICVSNPERVARLLVEWWLYQAIRSRSSSAQGDLLREMAGPRPGGYDPVLLACACVRPA